MNTLREARLRLTSSHLFVVIAATTGMILVFLTPPMQVADERCHLLRAWSFIDGHLFPVRGPDGIYNLQVASRILDDSLCLLGQTPFHPERRYDRSLITKVLAQPVRNGPPAFTPVCPGAAVNSPVAYAPQLVGLGAAFLWNASTPVTIWAGRLTNLCFFVLVTFLALRLLPGRSDLLVVLALMPMTLFQAASLSPDAALNALAFLFIAYTLHLQQSKAVRLEQVGKLLLLGMAIGLIKSAYQPITVIAWILVPAAFRSWRQGQKSWPLWLIALLPVCTLVAASSWSSTIAPYFDPRMWKPDVDVARQTEWLRAHPAATLRRLAVSLVHTVDHSDQFIGVLGWLDTPIPPVWRIIYGTLLAVAAFGLVRSPAPPNAPHPIGMAVRGVFVGTAVASILLGYFAVLIFWEKVGDGGPATFQGRYLIPVALLILLSLELPARLRRRAFIPRAALIGAIVVSQLVLLWTVWNRYYGV